MKCKICGAELKKDGELCNNCMNKLLQEQEIRNDKRPVYTFKSQFILGYELLKHIEQIGVAILAVVLIICLNKAYVKYALVFAIILLVYGLINLLYIKVTVNSVSCTVYRTKLFITKGFIRKKRIEIPFSEIEEIYCKQGNMNQLFKNGDIIIKKNSGRLTQRFFYIESIKDVDVAFGKIKEVYN